MRPLAILWDLDGVLWRSDLAHASAYRQVLDAYDLEMGDYKKISGRKTLEVMGEFLCHKRFTAADIIDATKKKQEIAREILRSDPPLMEGCKEVIEELAADFKQALVSSASRETISIFFEASGLKPFFNVMLSGEDCYKAKPSPELLLKAIALLELPPSMSIIVEDSAMGIMAAESAGIPVIAFGCDARTIQGKMVKYHVNKLCEIPDLLDSNY